MSKIRKNHHLIPAFTMIELILVIVILGVVASIGSDILKSLYDSYNITAKIQRLEAQANNAADIIAARLKQRIPQTTAALTSDGKYKSLNDADTNASLIFYLKAYELERDFATWQLNKAYTKPRASGYINQLESVTQIKANKYADDISIVSNDSSFEGLKTNSKEGYTIFFNDDSAIFYKPRKNFSDSKENNYLKAYYIKDKRSLMHPYFYGCGSYTTASGIKYAADKKTINKITMHREKCSTKEDDDVRPSMISVIHKYSLAKEVNEIKVENNVLKLFVLPAIPEAEGTKSRQESSNAKNYILARNVSTFRFTSLSSDPNIASGIVFKICIQEGSGEEQAEVCQSRIVQ